MTDFNPWLIAATACYLASKAEESSLPTTVVLKILRAKFPGTLHSCRLTKQAIGVSGGATVPARRMLGVPLCR